MLIERIMAYYYYARPTKKKIIIQSFPSFFIATQPFGHFSLVPPTILIFL